MSALAGVRGVTVSGDDVEELYAGSYARLVGVVALVAGSREEAEEVVQEAFVRLLPHWPRVCPLHSDNIGVGRESRGRTCNLLRGLDG
jgi:predicted RNA polymerase sigma factor